MGATRFDRVDQVDWMTPRRADWVAALDAAVAGAGAPVVLVGHRTACLLVAHWAREAPPDRLAMVRGALLAAPSDPDGASCLAGPTGFAPVPRDRLPFPSVVVASSNGEYVSLPEARTYAAAWGSEFVELANAGHINGESGLGDWAEGYAILERLRRGGATVA